MDRRSRLIVAITGASGAVYGLRLLAHLRERPGIETHLLVSPSGWLTIDAELGLGRAAVEALADRVHAVRDVGACIASGSFATDGMVVAPCSMRTLAAIAHGLSDNLITRAADVVLKERRRLVLLARETPLNLAHLRNMTAVTEMGGIVFPPVPAFYQRPSGIEAMVDHTIGRVLDLLGLPQSLAPAWTGRRSEGVAAGPAPAGAAGPAPAGAAGPAPAGAAGPGPGRTTGPAPADAVDPGQRPAADPGP